MPATSNNNATKTTAAEKVTKTTKVSKRHANKKVPKGVDEITNPGLRRIARRGGVKRISENSFDESRVLLGEFLNTVVKDAVIMSEAAGRKTVTTSDVAYSLKRQGHTLYGYN